MIIRLVHKWRVSPVFYRAAWWPAFIVNSHRQLTKLHVLATPPWTELSRWGHLQKSVPFFTNRCGLLLLECCQFGPPFGFDTVNNDEYSLSLYGPAHMFSAQPEKQSSTQNKPLLWILCIGQNTNFERICLISQVYVSFFQISILADCFHLYRMRKKTYSCKT